MTPIRVLLVEDDPVWQRCLSDYIKKESDIYVVTNASSRAEAVQICSLVDIDVVLMDIMLSERKLDGIEASIDILAMKKPKVIILTALGESEAILEAFAAGAVNYISKVHYTEIPQAIRSAYRNETGIHPDAAAVLREEYVRIKREEWRNRLTVAEREVLELLAQGHKQSAIQRMIHVTESTLKKHVHALLKKLGVTSSKEAVEKAKKRGIVR